MKKRIIAIIISLVITIHILPISTFALYTTPVLTSGNYTYTFNNNEVTITGVVDCISGNVVIPRNIDGFPVTKIGSRAFYECVGINSVIVPSSVTEIASLAFYGCVSLTNVIIEHGVTSIDAHAFENCYSLTNIAIPNSVTSISNGAFYNCKNLTSITIPNKITYIEMCLFYGCENLSNINLPDSITRIYSGAFEGTAYYKSTTNWQNNVLYIGNNLIVAKETIISCNIKPGTKVIADNAFRLCTELTNVTVPNSVVTIGDEAFAGCYKLTNIALPDSITSIGSDAFIHSGYYKNSNNWDNDCLYIDNYLLMSATQESHFNIKEGTKIIACNAFAYNKKIKSVYIPNSVVIIDDFAFHYCEGLTNVTVPNSVIKVGEYAFSHCTSLISATIGNGVSSINEGVFSGCKNLTKISLGNGIAFIGKDAFFECTSLANIVLPNKVSEIGYRAFGLCKGLTNIRIPVTLTKICDYAFWGCDGIKNVYYNGSILDEAKIKVESFNAGLLNPSWIYGKKVNISNAKISGIKTKSYTGKSVKQSIKVKLGSKTLKSGTDYTVSYKNNKSIGTATLTVKGKGKYSGTIKKTFTIRPKTVYLKHAKLYNKKQVKVTWKRDSKVSGYKVVYATNKKFTKPKSVTIKSNKTTTKTIKKLKSKKTYYIKVRSFRTVKGKRIYSAYSKVKKVKIK